jgi:hypothetical protein
MRANIVVVVILFTCINYKCMSTYEINPIIHAVVVYCFGTFRLVLPSNHLMESDGPANGSSFIHTSPG